MKRFIAMCAVLVFLIPALMAGESGQACTASTIRQLETKANATDGLSERGSSSEAVERWLSQIWIR